VAYYVEFVDPVLDYLGHVEGLTDDDRAAIVDGVIDELSRDADRFHALRPLAHESLCFRYDFPYLKDRTAYLFDFVVSAEYLGMGVVRVAYVEHTTETVS
jgi:hypothetical protein